MNHTILDNIVPNISSYQNHLSRIHSDVSMLITWNYPGGSECIDRFIVEHSPKCSSYNEPQKNMVFKVVYIDIKMDNYLIGYK